MTQALRQKRTVIDELDLELLNLINRRAQTVAEIARLKQEPGKDILAHGGAGFAQSLVLLGLVDEFRLLTHPVALGCGRALFVGLSYPLNLQLISSSAFPGGCIAHIYRPSPAWTLSARRLSKEVSHV